MGGNMSMSLLANFWPPASVFFLEDTFQDAVNVLRVHPKARSVVNILCAHEVVKWTALGPR